ncbi:MAG: phytoene desaturase family protein [Kineosporiaceae bacterium]
MIATPLPARARYDAVVVGAGHNGLTAAAYLARAGRSVCVLERSDHVGGATVSTAAFPGLDVRLSRYSYLVSLLPRWIVDELGLDLRLVRRRISSYTPDPRRGGEVGLLVDTGDAATTRASFAAVGADRDAEAWTEFRGRVGDLAHRIWPTFARPLLSRSEMRAVAADDELWCALVEEPVGVEVARRFGDDLVRGVVLTDALIGTFADPATDLAASRCFLYHVVGGGTGDWDVPVGGMGAVSGALARAAAGAGAEILTGVTVTGVDAGPEAPAVHAVTADGAELELSAGHVVWAAAPHHLDRAVGRHGGPAPEGSQLKVNMVLDRLPALRDGTDPATAFAGTFHVNQTATMLATAFAEAAAGRVPAVPPAEVYCHTLTDPSILGPGLRASGAHTLTVFGLHMPARVFRDDPEGARRTALERTLDSLDAILAEPIRDCLATGSDGRPAVEARHPVDLEADVALPGGHIFHRPLSWPWAEDPAAAGTWGVETGVPGVLLAGAGAVRGGGVSGIPGRSAAMAILGVDGGG